jgi:hypothetical protein
MDVEESRPVPTFKAISDWTPICGICTCYAAFTIELVVIPLSFMGQLITLSVWTVEI